MTFSLGARLKSFAHAFAGFAYMLRTQHNAWIHLLATLAVVVAGALMRVSADDWRWLVTAIALVWAAEAINTAFEHLCDVVSPEFHNSVKLSKDIAAAAVLVCAAAAVLIGLITFLPYALRYSAA
ncbi:MAG: diacylglycerol kinase family protein [Hyphomonadaceae bacterium]|nr:diacylglycerol kinase family protein [Hyphomonadaceae bacterium]